MSDESYARLLRWMGYTEEQIVMLVSARKHTTQASTIETLPVRYGD